jgi:hypothetical protein
MSRLLIVSSEYQSSGMPKYIKENLEITGYIGYHKKTSHFVRSIKA